MTDRDGTGVEIREVTTKAERKIFVDFPNRFFAENPNFVPAFYGDDMSDWDPKKNPAFSYCDAKAFLAYKGGKVVGRIGAILSHAVKSKGKSFHLLKVHNGKVAEIADTKGSELKGKSSEFSTYLLAYIDVNSAKTGDDFNPLIWIIICIVAVAGIVAILIARRRK